MARDTERSQSFQHPGRTGPAAWPADCGVAAPVSSAGTRALKFQESGRRMRCLFQRMLLGVVVEIVVDHRGDVLTGPYGRVLCRVAGTDAAGKCLDQGVGVRPD